MDKDPLFNLLTKEEVISYAKDSSFAYGKSLQGIVLGIADYQSQGEIYESVCKIRNKASCSRSIIIHAIEKLYAEDKTS